MAQKFSKKDLEGALELEKRLRNGLRRLESKVDGLTDKAFDLSDTLFEKGYAALTRTKMELERSLAEVTEQEAKPTAAPQADEEPADATTRVEKETAVIKVLRVKYGVEPNVALLKQSSDMVIDYLYDFYVKGVGFPEA